MGTPTHTSGPIYHTVNFGGFDISRDIGDPFISVEEPEDSWTLVGGLDGGVTRTRNKGANWALVTIALQYTSPDNDILSGIYRADIEVEGGIMVPLMVRDRLGTNLLVSTEAFIMKLPNFEVAKETGQVEWVICASKPERFQGGH